MFGIGDTEFVLILIFAFLLFGPDKLPSMGRTIGRGIRQFRQASDSVTKVVKSEVLDPITQSANATAGAPSAVAEDAGAAAAKDEEQLAKRSQETFAERRARLAAEKAARERGEDAASADDAPAGEPAEKGVQEEPAPEGEPAPEPSVASIWGLGATPAQAPALESEPEPEPAPAEGLEE